VNEATLFAKKHLKNFLLKKSTYLSYKAERLDNVSSQVVVVPPITFFLFKKGEDNVVKGQSSIKKVYSTSDCTFYTNDLFNNEAKYKVHPSKLRMEFYIDILQSFAVRGENIINVYSRSKLLNAIKVILNDLVLVIFESKIIFFVILRNNYCEIVVFECIRVL